MFSYQIAKDIHEERQREIERKLRLRFEQPALIARPSIRRRFGQGLIRLGSMLAADRAPAARLARDADGSPCG